MKKSNLTVRQIHVVVVDADPMCFAGLKVLFGTEADIQLVAATLSELAAIPPVDVVLLGKRNHQNLSQALQSLNRARPDHKILVVAPLKDEEDILDALANGARGFIDEAASAAEFISAIRIVDQGLIWATRKMLAMFVERVSKEKKRQVRGEITSREKEVLEMLVDGRSNKEIAAPLGIEERTVKAHVSKLMRKVGVQSRVLLSVHAINSCLVVPR